MTCDEVQQFLVDEGASRPRAWEAHLASCAACQGFGQAQAAALRLRGAAATPARRLPLERVRRRAATVAAAALVVVGASGWWQLEGRALPAGASPAAAVASLEGQLEVSPPEAALREFRGDGSLAALEALAHEVAAGSRRNPAVHDAAYRPFGALPTWLALRTTPPIRSLGGAVSPLVYSLEE
jgi:hypothetical protein